MEKNRLRLNYNAQKMELKVQIKFLELKSAALYNLTQRRVLQVDVRVQYNDFNMGSVARKHVMPVCIYWK